MTDALDTDDLPSDLDNTNQRIDAWAKVRASRNPADYGAYVALLTAHALTGKVSVEWSRTQRRNREQQWAALTAQTEGAALLTPPAPHSDGAGS